MNATDDLRPLVPYTFEESLANWADVLEGDADDAASRGPRARVSLCIAHVRDIAAHLRGAARLLETEAQR